MEISKLSDLEIKNITNALKNDNFQHIENMKHFIKFNDATGFRTFELYGNSLQELQVSLNLDVILQKLYFEKTRYSQSLQQHLEQSDNENIEELLSELEWSLVEVLDMVRNKDWTHDMDSDIFFTVLINDINHIIVNQHVYHGEIDTLEALGKAPIEMILKDTNIYNLLTKL